MEVALSILSACSWIPRTFQLKRNASIAKRARTHAVQWVSFIKSVSFYFTFHELNFILSTINWRQPLHVQILLIPLFSIYNSSNSRFSSLFLKVRHTGWPLMATMSRFYLLKIPAIYPAIFSKHAFFISQLIHWNIFSAKTSSVPL